MRLHINQHVRTRGLAAVTILGTGAISFISTRNLAHELGFGPLSWLYPICLDAAAAVGMDLWLSRSPAWRQARVLTLIAVALSLAANVADRLLIANVADWLLMDGTGAAVAGAVPPLMLAGLLLVVHKHTTVAATSKQQEESASTSQAASAPASGDADRAAPARPAAGPLRRRRPGIRTVPRRPGHQPLRRAARISRRPAAKPKVEDLVLVTLIREHEQSHGPLTRRQAMARFELGTGRATRLLALARNGHGHS